MAKKLSNYHLPKGEFYACQGDHVCAKCGNPNDVLFGVTKSEFDWRWVCPSCLVAIVERDTNKALKNIRGLYNGN